MTCLCCSKPLLKENEQSVGWHASCVKGFFGTSKLPVLDLKKETMQQIAVSNVEQGYTVPGVQKKLSMQITQGRNSRLTLSDHLPGYILKPQSPDYENLPEAEFLAMHMAKATRIRTVPFALIQIMTEEKAYITKRIDRKFSMKHSHDVEILAMEDFCQLDQQLTKDKYIGSYERCAKIILKHSSRPGIDLTELFLQLVFSFVIGNSDLHLKNLSLLETFPTSGEYELSPAYDLLPVQLFVKDPDEMALTMGGKKRNLTFNDFVRLGESIGLALKTTYHLIYQIISMKEVYQQMIRLSYLPETQREALLQLIDQRIKILQHIQNKGRIE